MSGRLPQHTTPSRLSTVISTRLSGLKRGVKSCGQSSADLMTSFNMTSPLARCRTRFNEHHERRHHPYKIEGGSEEGLTTPRRPEANASALAEVCRGLSPRDKQQLGIARRTDKVMTFLQSARERKIPVRSGKWHPEEDAYLRRLIELFNAGVLDGMPVKVSLRGWLSKMLNCCPMRISKKQSHGEKFEGKIKYKRDIARIDRMTQAEYNVACDHVAHLRSEFIKAWAKDELNRRTTQVEDMTFDEWYLQVLALVPAPRIARNQRINGIDSTTHLAPRSAAYFHEQLTAEGKCIELRTRNNKDGKAACRRPGITASKCTLRLTTEEPVDSDKPAFTGSAFSSALDVPTNSECFVDMLTHFDDGIKNEIDPVVVDGQSTLEAHWSTKLSAEGINNLSQPFSEDIIPDCQQSMNLSGEFAEIYSMGNKLPVLRLDLSDSGDGVSCTGAPTSDVDTRTLSVAIDHFRPACVPVADDLTAPTVDQGLGENSALEEIALLSTDADLFSLDEIPLDSWLYDSLTATTTP